MKTLSKIAFLAGLAAVGGQLAAQPSNDEPVPAASASAGLTAEQMAANAEIRSKAVRDDLQHLLYLQAVARREKDVIKLSCVNEQYVIVKASANRFDTARETLLGVLDSEVRRVSAYEQLITAADESKKGREAADACVGQVELSGESAGTFTAPDLVDDPTAGLPFDDPSGGPAIEPPGYASPFN